jgi:hypothetical protein
MLNSTKAQKTSQYAAFDSEDYEPSWNNSYLLPNGTSLNLNCVGVRLESRSFNSCALLKRNQKVIKRRCFVIWKRGTVNLEGKFPDVAFVKHLVTLSNMEENEVRIFVCRYFEVLWG